ncbi:tail fiber assembly protein [Pseudomonas sp. SZMC_28357]|uniref:tail fiber assembly protein n=1 Tax=Pseudomonas sp. SZMC_28357 TaxID=3074380 RepID=UPI002871A574|nr:tail fiber assembly protein [Pseudomonas sp. SZMC_28357]MDR9749836.1 tail fiber assembly protein [Pseudomonas sp. SZMC_28357]
MTILFYAAVTSFDDVPDGGDIPVGAVEISWALRQDLLDGQSAGKSIKADENGYPILVDRPIPPRDYLSEAVTEAAKLRSIADYAITPLQDAVDIDDATDVEVALLKAWKKYRIALNRLPEQPGYPASILWPATPV